eukprot:g27744.t1
MARSDVEPWIALDVDFRTMRELNGNGGAISSYFEKTQFTGEVVAVLAPSHGHNFLEPWCEVPVQSFPACLGHNDLCGPTATRS